MKFTKEDIKEILKGCKITDIILSDRSHLIANMHIVIDVEKNKELFFILQEIFLGE